MTSLDFNVTSVHLHGHVAFATERRGANLRAGMLHAVIVVHLCTAYVICMDLERSIVVI